MCVKAAGAHDPRTSHADETTGITLSLDYCFTASTGGENDVVDACEAESDVIKVLVLYDHHMKAVHATQVKQKGPLEEVTEWVLQRLDFAGYAGCEITLKSDQEVGLLALRSAVAARRSARTCQIDSQVRVSKTNTHVEGAIRRWREQFRKLKIHLEEKADIKITAGLPLVGWMVAWAAEVLLRFAVDESGRTAFERMTGHRVRHKVFAFGERILFKPAADPGHRNKLDGEWMCGFFAGVVSRSGEYLVIVGDRNFRAPTARALLEKQGYDGKVVQ